MKKVENFQADHQKGGQKEKKINSPEKEKEKKNLLYTYKSSSSKQPSTPNGIWRDRSGKHFEMINFHNGPHASPKSQTGVISIREV